MQLTKKSESKHPIVHKPKTAAMIPDVGLVLLDSSLKPLAFDRGAAAILDYANQLAIPEEVLRVIRSRKPADLSAVKTIFHRGKNDYICRAYMVESEVGFLAEPIVALHLERDSTISNAMNEAAAKYNLTEREQEALKGISTGLTNKELAERMNISPNTVRAFLRLIMVKMGVTTRSGIVAKILQDRHNLERIVSLPTEKELAV
jgi:DNA-binding NarL/FixJ family response regulator